MQKYDLFYRFNKNVNKYFFGRYDQGSFAEIKRASPPTASRGWNGDG